MLTEKKMLDKIKYSGKFDPKDIKIYYYDRIRDENLEVEFEDISIKRGFIVLGDSEIPLHRLREIRNKGVIIWKRK